MAVDVARYPGVVPRVRRQGVHRAAESVSAVAIFPRAAPSSPFVRAIRASTVELEPPGSEVSGVLCHQRLIFAIEV